MSLLSTLNTGSTGLRVASAGLAVTAHNVANATTEGYSRRTLRSSVANPIVQGGLTFGQGVDATGFGRSADRFLNANLISAWGDQSQSQAMVEQLSAVESAFDESSSSGIAAAYEQFFDDLASLALDPSDDSLRQVALSSASGLAESVNRTSSTLHGSMNDMVEQVSSGLDEIQADLDAVAALNDRIGAADGEQGAGDYADRLYQLTTELAGSIGAQVDFAEDGQATLLVGGHAIVSGSTARTLALGEDASGGPKLTVSADGATLDITSDLGGTMGGLLDAYEAVSSLQSSVDDFATDLADAFNAQHEAGFDSNGDAGIAFFTYTVGDAGISFAVDSSIVDDPSLMALAGASSAAAGDGDNLAELYGLQDQDLFSGGTQTGTEAVGSIYSTVGNLITTAELESERSAAVVADLSELRDAVSGVDIDEEATDLMEWQTAYEAASRVVSAANEMLGVLMEMAR